MSEYLKVALKAAGLAAPIVRRSFRTSFSVKEKGDRDFVSSLDLQSEKIIMDCISKKFPSHGFISEEAGEINASADSVWIIDPIDGTNNYISGIDLFGINIALRHKGELVVGVTVDPVRREAFYAEKGSGAFMNGKRIHVGGNARTQDSIISMELGHNHNEEALRMVSQVGRESKAIRILGSTAIGLADVACNRLQGVVYGNCKVWDVAAGKVLIEEAGGKVFNLNGWHWSSEKGVVAGNAALCRKLLGLAGK